VGLVGLEVAVVALERRRPNPLLVLILPLDNRLKSAIPGPRAISSPIAAHIPGGGLASRMDCVKETPRFRPVDVDVGVVGESEVTRA